MRGQHVTSASDRVEVGEQDNRHDQKSALPGSRDGVETTLESRERDAANEIGEQSFIAAGEDATECLALDEADNGRNQRGVQREIQAAGQNDPGHRELRAVADEETARELEGQAAAHDQRCGTESHLYQ